METIGDRIKKLRESRDLTQTDLAKLVGAKTYTTISKWESNDNFPKGKDIKNIADIFKVSSDYLLGLEIINDSKNITTIYNNLEKPRQQKVYSFAEHQLEEQNSNVVDFPQKSIKNGRSTAAGSPIDGDYQDGEYSTMIVSTLEIPSGADEIVTIAGESMEPTHKQGSQVFVHYQPTVEQGEVAIVSIADEGVTCKKVYYDFENSQIILQSINEKYEDLVRKIEDVRVIGLVL